MTDGHTAEHRCGTWETAGDRRGRSTHARTARGRSEEGEQVLCPRMRARIGIGMELGWAIEDHARSKARRSSRRATASIAASRFFLFVGSPKFFPFPGRSCGARRAEGAKRADRDVRKQKTRLAGLIRSSRRKPRSLAPRGPDRRRRARGELVEENGAAGRFPRPASDPTATAIASAAAGAAQAEPGRRLARGVARPRPPSARDPRQR